jgi:hypothetical protein
LCAKAGDISDYFDRHFHRSHDPKIDDEEEGRDSGRARVGYANAHAEEEEGEEGGSRNFPDGITFGGRIAQRDPLTAKLRHAEKCISISCGAQLAKGLAS